jgi:hypothetical protein
LNDSVGADALRQVLVRRPDADLLHAAVLSRKPRRGCQGVVRLELHHGPDGHSHGGERLFERVELREQRPLDALRRLVARPEAVSERLDDVIGRHADVRGSLLDHLQHGTEHAGRGGKGPLLDPGDAAKTVEVPEQLVRAVHEVYEHAQANASNGDILASGSQRRSADPWPSPVGATKASKRTVSALLLPPPA